MEKSNSSDILPGSAAFVNTRKSPAATPAIPFPIITAPVYSGGNSADNPNMLPKRIATATPAGRKDKMKRP